MSEKRASHRGELLKLLAFATLGMAVLPTVLAAVLVDVAELPGWLPLITGVLVVGMWVSFLPSWVAAWRHPERWTGYRMKLRDVPRAFFEELTARITAARSSDARHAPHD